MENVVFPIYITGFPVIFPIMKPKKKGRGRPPKGPTVRLSTDIRPDLRDMVDAMKAKTKWTLAVTVETILEDYFKRNPQEK